MSRTRLVTAAKRFAKYIYSRHGNGCLVHEVASVELRWCDVDGKRLQNPTATIYTKCGSMRYSWHSILSDIIMAPAVLCRKCQGLGATVRHRGDEVGPSGFTRNEAAARLERLIPKTPVIQ